MVVIDEKENKSTKKEEIKECVFLHQKGISKMVFVTTGAQDDDYIEIKSGINTNDEVLSGPYGAISKTLKDGSKIKIVDKDKLFTEKK